MKAKLPLFLFAMLAAASVQAQMYKWVDSNGRITYSDMPPPPSIKQSQIKSAPTLGDDEVALPYSLSIASRDHPVVLYAGSECAPCQDARSLLKQRGIPYSERTVSSNDDIAALKQVGGDGRLPYLTIGRNGITGYDAGSWNSALTAAGYPESSRLPANYRQKQAQSAAPAPVTASNTGTGQSGAGQEKRN